MNARHFVAKLIMNMVFLYTVFLSGILLGSLADPVESLPVPLNAITGIYLMLVCGVIWVYGGE